MITKRLVKYLVAASALALWAGQAQAATFSLNLTGVVANSQFFSFDSGGTHYDQWLLPLSGLDPSDQITVSQGDTIDATITLDQLFTIPASVQLTNIGFFLSGSAFPAINTGVTGTTTLFNGLTQVVTGSATTTTSSQLANTADFFSPNNPAFTFDSMTSSFNIYDLSQSATLNNAAISYTLFSPSAVAVPEPGTWAMMLIGLGGLGAAMRSRRKAAVATA